MTVRTNGPIFTGFKRVLDQVQARPLSPDIEDCSRRVVERLREHRTTNDRPGMLLGRIQSGKTRAFVGSIAIALDSGWDIAVVLTKGTVALTKQTVTRLKADLADSATGNREVIIQDVAHLRARLTDWEQGRKLIFVCKKQARNLMKLEELMLHSYPSFALRDVLLVDDEADTTSVGYDRRTGVLDLRVIPAQIDTLRTGLGDHAFYLQVTATPQALYLQPVEIIRASGQRARHVRPVFTETVPFHTGYVGGREYFEASHIPGSTESFLHVAIDPTELAALKQNNPALLALGDVLVTPLLAALRRALVTFVVAGCVRTLQRADAGKPSQLYGMIFHTETKRAAHAWQEAVTVELIQQLQHIARTDIARMRPMIDDAFNDLRQSITSEVLPLPDVARVLEMVPGAFGSITVETVNHDKDMIALLDESTGQLHLRAPYNVFIGGQILDRGLTIDNLIAFYYGRSPRIAQEDTTLQHCRMYGNRDRADVAVTRFYTTPAIYNRMRGIHERDEALWQSIEAGVQDPDVIFMSADATGDTRPCGLQKIAASRVTTLRPARELLPVGFHTASARQLLAARDELDGLLQDKQEGQPFEASLDEAVHFTELSHRMLQMDDGFLFDWTALKAAIRFLGRNQNGAVGRDRALCMVRRDLNISKFRLELGVPRLQNEPQGPRDPSAVRAVAGSSPGLIMLRQNGLPDRGWSGEAFYWPILVIPSGITPRIFAEERG